MHVSDFNPTRVLRYAHFLSNLLRPRCGPPKPGGAFIQHAAELGANAAVGMRYDATEIMQGVTEVLAYGTAVYVEKKSQYIRAAGLKNCLDGEPGRNRTCDPRIKSALLYQLSYGPTLLI